MALRRLTLPIIFAFLLFSQVFARDLEEKPDNKDTNVAGAEDAKFPCYRPRPPCRFHCHGRCCSAEEFAAISQAADQVDASVEKHEADFYIPGRPFCRHYCSHSIKCCSAEEYAEYMQGRN